MTKRARSMEKGTRAMAERTLRAEEDFISNLMQLGGIDRASAVRVLAYYRKHKLVKMDAVIGRMDVKDGAFLDHDVIQRAAAL